MLKFEKKISVAKRLTPVGVRQSESVGKMGILIWWIVATNSRRMEFYGKPVPTVGCRVTNDDDDNDGVGLGLSLIWGGGGARYLY